MKDFFGMRALQPFLLICILAFSCNETTNPPGRGDVGSDTIPAETGTTQDAEDDSPSGGDADVGVGACQEVIG